MRFLFFITFIVVVLWCAGFGWFVSGISDTRDGGKANTDAIIVLTGGTERIQEGIRLLSKRRAKKLFISGVGEHVTVKGLLKRNKVSDKAIRILRSDIILGHVARDTQGNAKEVASWIQKESYTSLFLVTSNYHMARSLVEFKKYLPNIKIEPYPVFPDNVKIKKWWSFEGTRELLLKEYNKYLFTLLNIREAFDYIDEIKSDAKSKLQPKKKLERRWEDL